MAANQWLLVEWVDERNVFPSYGVVNAVSLVSDDGDLHPGKMTFVRSKHGNSARRAQILRTSDDKRHVKEYKLLLERQDHQVKNMLSLCMRTIKEIKTDPLIYGSFHSNQQTIDAAGGSGTLPPVANDSSSFSEEELTNDTKCLQISKSSVSSQLKRITEYHKNVRAESHFVKNNSNLEKLRSVVSSTPLPSNCNGKESSKLTFDQATQTDVPLTNQVPLDKIERIEAVLSQLYRQFLTLVGRLQLDCQDYSMYNSDVEDNRTVESERENPVYDFNEETDGTLNLTNTNAEKDVRLSAKSLQIRRVSAHTTNTVEQSFPINNDMVSIGAGHASVPARLLNEINWDSYSSATRQLLQAIFPRKVLATHSLTGKKSPAFANKPAKKCLDPKLIEDIVETVSERCGVTKRSVRNCITIKCTDEAKLYRNRMQGRIMNQGCAVQENMENVPPSPAMSPRASSNESG